MIHVAIGTKAQLIKMAPVLWGLKRRQIVFNLVDLGQHALITRDLRNEFGLDEPHVCLGKDRNIATVASALRWLGGIGLKSLACGSHLKKKLFQNQGGVCLIHGDTISTLVGLYLAKRSGLQVAHIEAGLRSFCWREPFPEETVRLLAMRFSDILFAPSGWAFDNLARMGLKKKAVLLSSNTGQETVAFSLAKSSASSPPEVPFCLATVHRLENIFSKKRLLYIIELLERVTSFMPVVFILHEPTMRSLRRFGLTAKVEAITRLSSLKIVSHRQFVGLLHQCGFVITDGGSVQEEACYLGTPCLLLRRYTERTEGLGANAVLSRFDQSKTSHFINHYTEFRMPPRRVPDIPASEMIVDTLLKDGLSR